MNPYDPKATGAMEGLRHLFISRGSAASVADHQTYVAMFGMVQQQATLLSFLDVFRMLTWIFLAMAPLILLMKKPGKSSGPPAAH